MNFLSDRKRIERLTSEGLKKLASNDYSSAWLSFEQILFLDDDNPLANTLGAASLLNLGRLDDAESLARKGVRLTPHLALSHYYLAVILIAKEHYEEGESEIWEAIAIEPYNAESRLILARALFLQERDSEARDQLVRCIELSPDNAEAHFLLGLALMRGGDIRGAKYELEQTVHLQPENDAALAFDGLLSMAKADDLMTTPPKLAGYRYAASHLRRAIEINPANELAVEWLRLAEETHERISSPTEPPAPEKWYKESLKLLLVWGVLAMLSIAMFALMIWLDESKTADFWVVILLIAAFDLVAFGMMLYLRKDFSALPPSIVLFIERVTDDRYAPQELIE